MPNPVPILPSATYGRYSSHLDFLRREKPEGPCLVVDLDVIRDNYEAFDRAMPGTRIFYAVKANPAPEILSLLAILGS